MNKCYLWTKLNDVMRNYVWFNRQLRGDGSGYGNPTQPHSLASLLFLYLPNSNIWQSLKQQSKYSVRDSTAWHSVISFNLIFLVSLSFPLRAIKFSACNSKVAVNQEFAEPPCYIVTLELAICFHGEWLLTQEQLVLCSYSTCELIIQQFIISLTIPKSNKNN